MIRFIRKGGRVIPINISGASKTLGHVPKEIEHIVEVRKARKLIQAGAKFDEMGWTFWKYTRDRAAKTGGKIAKRIARFAAKGIIKK